MTGVYITLGCGWLLALTPLCLDQSCEFQRLLKDLSSTDASRRKTAAEELASPSMPGSKSFLWRQVKQETDAVTRLALYYALVSHGDVQAVEPLLEAVRNDDCLGAHYLAKATGIDFGMREDLWRRWIKTRATGDQFQRLIRQRQLQQNEPATRVDMMAWARFRSAARLFQRSGNSEDARVAFRNVANHFSKSDCAPVADELAFLLDMMAKEERAWKEPSDFTKLPLP